MGERAAETAELSERECWERLRQEAYGRLAVVGADGPEIYPINALVDHGTIVFRTTAGTKLDAIRADARVAFEVDGWDRSDGTAWSVAVRGTAREIVGMHESVGASELGLTPWQAGPKPSYVRITPTTTTGRRFHRADLAQPDDTHDDADRIEIMNTSTDDTVLLTEDECWALLDRHSVARLAVDVGGRPDIFPINYVVDDGALVFRSGAGTKLAGAVLGRHVAVEIDGYDQLDGSVWSVVVKGVAREIDHIAERFDIEDLPLYPWVASHKPNFVRIAPDLTTGRRFHRINEPMSPDPEYRAPEPPMYPG